MGGKLTKPGFALPTILIASFVMLSVLVNIMVLTASTVTQLNASSHDRYAKAAAESGLTMARECLKANGGIVTWSASSPLRPNTNCNGGPACINSPSCFVYSDSQLRTTFSVEDATLLLNSTYRVTVKGSAELLRKSTGLAWRTYNDTLNSVVGLNETPKISGGAGWKDSGHLGIVITETNQLYGFGDNSTGQLSTPATPTITTPRRMILPSGVQYIKQAVTSGQGATVICILGSDNQAYCRGNPGGGESNFLTSPDWNRVSGWPTTYSVYDISINGWGAEAACFLVGTSRAQAQVYCIGEPRWGQLGTGYSCPYWGSSGTCDFYMISDARRFLLPASTYASKVITMNDQTCVLTTAQEVYCSGLNNGGQVTGTTSNVLTPVKFNLPNGRKAKDVLVAGYHDGQSQTVRVLATDGTIWSAGWNPYGSMGTGAINTNTFSSRTPELFGGFGSSTGGTGDLIRLRSATGKCFDNMSWSSANGNPVGIWDCGGPDNQGQRWIYDRNTHTIANVANGKCLDFEGGVAANGTKVQIYDCNGSVAQKFTIQSSGLISVDNNPNYCIDLPNTNTTNGTLLQIYQCNSSSAQLFQPDKNINGWEKMIVGSNYFCGIREDPSSGMMCAGQNANGELGNFGARLGAANVGGRCVDSAVPLQVQLPPGEEVDMSRYSSEWAYQYDSLMIITKNGNVYGSGTNSNGKLGNGILGDSANNYRTCELYRTLLPANVEAIDMSTRDEYSTYILGSNATVYGMGRNNVGQLGDGSMTDRLLPSVIDVPKEQIIIY